MNINKIVRVGKGADGHIFCKIKYEDGKLSITGVEGPLSNGDCKGGCGQIIMHDWGSIQYAPGWDAGLVAAFRNIWDEWHLNDMCAYTPEMKAQGWDKLATTEIYKWGLIRTDECEKELAALKATIQDSAINDKKTQLDDRQKRLLNSERLLDIYSYDEPEPPEFMQLWVDYKTGKPKKERKTLGWVRVDEHPDGLLCKKLDGKGYGEAWYKHDIPQEAIDFLAELPETDIRPSWV